MRWVPWLLPIGVVIAILAELHELGQNELAAKIVGGLAVAAIVLAALGSQRARSPGPGRPGTFILCWVIGALAFWRFAVAIIWTAAHSTLDADGLAQSWYPLVIGVLSAAGGIAVARPPASR